MKTSVFFGTILSLALLAVSCNDHDTIPDPNPDQLKSEDFVDKLVAPISITKGANGSIWVAELGTGTGNDGQVSLITPDGKAHPAVTGFLSVISPEGTPAGLSHLLVIDNTLYILHGAEGKLYKFDLTGFVPGKSSAVNASSLKTENIGEFVKNYKFETDNNESNLYDLTLGFGGDLFITDAAANAVIRRKANGDLSVFYEFLPYKIPQGTPPVIDFVPTGIAYDGKKLLITSLTGVPFVDGKASIQQLDAKGIKSVYKEGFTTLVDIVLTPSNRPLVLQLARFSLSTTPPGFIPNSGKILDGSGATLLDGLMMPTDLERVDDKTYFLVSMATGKITKLTY